MTQIDIKGTVVDDDTAIVYDFFEMKCASPKSVNDALNDGSDDDVMVNIASNGGDVFAASEIYTSLRQCQRNVVVNIQGLAASAASVIAMAGNQVNISPTGQIMIHQAMSGTVGNKDDMAKQIDILDGIDKSIASAYEAKTGIDQGELLNMMANETWLGAQDAVNKGFADQIMFVNEDELQPVNSTEQAIPKRAVNKLLNLINKAESVKTLKTNEKIEEEKENSRLSDLRSQKAAILLEKI
ncbi:head maturation protease, ClpP-related [Convivina praedatoris]|uniref:head maturation protease, ClpP-related n=1 Tax=Convivina praedatoris TaxID=2880963 RepID=UPI00200CDBED|nr:head maturation protease, ClpP-related [Convivina sp. LMG 32447]CAH1855172.1 ATP-dependent Clp protease proteolytic subunit [Convivina sp. LMG 32447]